MPSVRISDLWTPQIWGGQVREKQATFPIILNSQAVVQSPLLASSAAGAGVSVNVPTWRDITDQADEVQVEATAPTNTNGITTANQVAPILNRVSKSGVEALAAQVSGSDPVSEITMQLAARRLKQRQASLIALLRGAFGTSSGAALGNAAALAGVRLTIGDESGNAAAAAELISPDAFINAKTLMGELADGLRSGALFMHSTVRATLEKLDASSFKTGNQSGLPFQIDTYRGVPVFICDALVRAGTTSGFVYDTYLISNGALGVGEKPQVVGTIDRAIIDVASLNYQADPNTNSEFIYDRTRCILHLNGMRWTGSPAGQSATNAELGTLGNWALAYTSANRVGAVCIVSNG